MKVWAVYGCLRHFGQRPIGVFSSRELAADYALRARFADHGCKTAPDIVEMEVDRQSDPNRLLKQRRNGEEPPLIDCDGSCAFVETKPEDIRRTLWKMRLVSPLSDQEWLDETAKKLNKDVGWIIKVMKAHFGPEGGTT